MILSHTVKSLLCKPTYIIVPLLTHRGPGPFPVNTVLISKPQIIIHRDSYLLIGAQIPLGGLDRGVAEQELDLLQIAAAFAAELGTGSAQVVSTEVLDSDLLR